MNFSINDIEEVSETEEVEDVEVPVAEINTGPHWCLGGYTEDGEFVPCSDESCRNYIE